MVAAEQQQQQPERSSLKTEKSFRKRQKEIEGLSWGDLEIYEFPNILGDNPGASDGGAPITIDWKHEKKSVVGVDYYEFIRKSQPRRKRKELLMSGGQRDS